MDELEQLYIPADLTDIGAVGINGAGWGIPVKLGRLPKPPGSAAVNLGDFFPGVSAVAVPEAVDYSAKARESLRQVYGNDRQGNCVIASGAHGIGLWTGNDSDSGGIVVGTAQECVSEYHRIGGPADRGLVITQALNDFARNGLLLGGKRHKIAGWAAVPHTLAMVKAAIAVFGGVRIGFNLPGYWQRTAREGFLWRLANAGGFVGGHDVRLVGYNPTGVLVSTWGVVGVMEWAAMADRRIVDEIYVEVSEQWTGPDGQAPSRYDAAGLLAALARVKSGDAPDWLPDVEPVPVPWTTAPDPLPVG